MSAVGLRTGYEANFSETVGIRVYLSAITSFQFAGSVKSGFVPGLDMYLLGDIDADVLINFIREEDFKFGMYVGLLTGVMSSIPLKDASIMGVGIGQDSKSSFGVATGVNIGLRSVVRKHHDFEIGMKLAAALYNDSSATFGAFMLLATGYNYKF